MNRERNEILLKRNFPITAREHIHYKQDIRILFSVKHILTVTPNVTFTELETKTYNIRQLIPYENFDLELL